MPQPFSHSNNFFGLWSHSSKWAGSISNLTTARQPSFSHVIVKLATMEFLVSTSSIRWRRTFSPIEKISNYSWYWSQVIEFDRYAVNGADGSAWKPFVDAHLFSEVNNSDRLANREVLTRQKTCSQAGAWRGSWRTPPQIGPENDGDFSVREARVSYKSILHRRS